MSSQFFRPKHFEDFLTIFREFHLIQREPDADLPRNYERVQIDLEALMGDEVSEEVLEQLEKWLELPESSQEDWSGGKNSNYETIAWYQPITFSQTDAGIFLTLKGLRLYASKNLRALRGLGLPKREVVQAAWFGAFSQLLTHEIFHHQIEWMAFRFDTNLGVLGSSSLNPSHAHLSRYANYTFNVYRPSLRLPPDGALEEALASANEYVRFPRSFKAGKTSFQYSKQVHKVIRERIRSGYGSRPVGYREAPSYLDNLRFKQGVSNLLAQVLNPVPAIAPKVLPPGLGIQQSELTNHFLSNFTIVVESGDTSILDFPMSLVVPDMKLKKLLRAEGFHLTDLGKGSHEVWKKPGSPMVTVPNRKDQAGLKFLKSTARTLGYKNLRELQEAASNV